MRITRFLMMTALATPMAFAGTSPEAPVMGTYLPGVSGHAHGKGCRVLTEEEAATLRRTHAKAEARPLARQGPDIRPMSAPPGPDDPYAATVPSSYINPVELVKDQGHLFHEVEIEISSERDHHRLDQVFSFEVPDWARYMLVEFVPSGDGGRSGMYLRPHRPFTGDVFHEADFVRSTQLTQAQALAYSQAAYRSEHNARGSEPGFAQFVLVTRDMDPAPAGKEWHVAIGQLSDDRDIEGTLRVWFSGSSYRAPLAIEFYYDAQEEADQVGFFDPTPREPDGDNPGATQGEAMRWILFQAAEELLEELDFDGLFPIRVLVTTTDDNSGLTGVASSNVPSGEVHPRYHAPGRLRARLPGRVVSQPSGTPIQRFYRVPLPAFEREAGTDVCRARPGHHPGICENDAVMDAPGTAGSTRGWIRLLRDFETDSGGMWRWDKNLHDRAGGANIVNLIKHELMHIVGFSTNIRSQAYVATFDPPRRLYDAPAFYTSEEHHGTWVLTGSRRHHYGPIASTSPHNPWRDTIEPGPRLQDDALDNIAHLMPADGDELAHWDHRADYMRPGGSGFGDAKGPGVAKDILADLGYARGTRSIQDRRLPRHWFDPERSGHGIDFRRVDLEDGSTVHFLHLYTYDADGNPEWYLASGEVGDDLIFEGELHYVTYEEGRSPSYQPDPGRSGTFHMDLDPPFDHPACAERRPLRPEGTEQWLYATFEWDLPNANDSGTWCLEPMRFGDQPAWPQEGSGSWFAADHEDSGWGLTVVTRNYGPRPIVNVVAYYYDVMGDPTWAWGVNGGGFMLPSGSLGEGVEVDMLHFHGFCRTCEPIDPDVEPAGTIRLKINSQAVVGDEGNMVELLDLSDRGPVGGEWFRENIGIRLLSSPHPKMAQ